MTNLKTVVLDCPYNTWSHTATQELFSAIVALKLKGYQPVYEDGVMPVDSYDFIATHLLVCAEEGSKLRPVTGFKSVTFSRCQRFNLPFPTTAILGAAAGTDPHSKAVAQIIAKCRDSGREIAFDSSWTVDPDCRKSRELNLLLHELFISNVTHWHTAERSDEVLGTGIIRVRTNRFFERVGFRQVEAGGAPLPPFGQASLRGTAAVLIHLQEWSPFAREAAAAHRNVWENRIVIQ